MNDIKNTHHSLIAMPVIVSIENIFGFWEYKKHKQLKFKVKKKLNSFEKSSW